MPVRYLSEEEIREARKGLPKDPNILLNDDEQMVEGQTVSKPSRYQELKQELEDSKRRQQSERDAAKGLADPMEYQASKLDATPEDLQTAANQRSIGQMANIASVGLDQATQFSDKKFDNSASRSINTDVSENYGKAMGARQVLADKLRARAEEQRTRPATEGGKYAAAEALDTKNITDRISNPIEVAGKQARANVDMRADDFGAATYDSKVDSTLLADEAGRSKSRTDIDTEGDRLEKSKLGIVSDRLSNDGKRLSNSGVSISNQNAQIGLNQNKVNNDAESSKVKIIKGTLFNDLSEMARNEQDPAKKKELEAKAEEVRSSNLTFKDIEDVKSQYPNLSLKQALIQAKLEGKAESDRLKYERGTPLSTSETKDITGLNQTVEALDDIKGLKEAIGTGKVSDFLSTQKAKLGIDAPDMRVFKQKLTGMLAKYMNSISGAAVNEGELKRLKLAIPSPDLTDDVFMASLEAFREDLVRNRKISLDSMKSSHKDVSGHAFDKYDPKDVVKSGVSSSNPSKEVSRTLKNADGDEVTLTDEDDIKKALAKGFK